MGNLNLQQVLKSLIDQGINIVLQDGKVIFEGDMSTIDTSIKRYLQENKAAIVKLLSSENNSPSLPPLLAAQEQGMKPLSFAQQRLWMQQQLEPESAYYHVPLLIRMQGKLDYSAMHSAFADLVDRHQVLRTVYCESEDTVYCKTLDEVDFVMPVQDLSKFSKEQRQQVIASAIKKIVETPFKLNRDLMLRVALLKFSSVEHLLVVCMHHIASDGWSLSVLTKELVQLYAAYRESKPSPLDQLELQYSDFSLWQRDVLQGDFLESLLAYWRKRLKGLPSVHSLALDHPRKSTPSYRGAIHKHHLSNTLTQHLESYVQHHGATLFMGLHAAFVALLQRYSGEQDIIVGTPIANREHSGLASLVGFFVNSLVLRSELASDESFESLLLQSKTRLLEAYAHQQLPFEKLVEEIKPARSNAHSPLFQVMISLNNNPQSQLNLPDLTISAIEENDVYAKYELSLNIWPQDGYLELHWEYATDLFDAETIMQMSESFEYLLQQALACPQKSLEQLSLLPQEKSDALIKMWNSHEQFVPDGRCFFHMFETQVEANPEQTAVICGQQRLSYGEINNHANQLARYLLAQGLSHKARVGVCLPRTPELLLSLLAIHKVGACYVPLDPDYPQARLDYIVNDSGLCLLLVNKDSADILENYQGLRIDITAYSDYQCHAANNLPQEWGAKADDPAYIIYTSGSTGQPKGVEVLQKSLSALLTVTRDCFSITANDTMAAMASHAFDISLFEMLLPLVSGGSAQLIPREVTLDFPQLMECLSKCSLIHAVPSLMSEIVAHAFVENSQQVVSLSSVRQVFVGGDKVSPLLIKRLQTCFAHAQIVELYGPTEGTILSTYHIIERDTEPSASIIGRALPHANIYVLDQRMQPLASGIVGELYIGGLGIAEGYVSQPELTETRFPLDPFSSHAGERLYRTGDLVKWRHDNTLEYIGRADNQVKVRGYRIEPGEIEYHLNRLHGVVDALVHVAKNTSGDTSLLAYLLSDNPAKLDIHSIKQYLQKQLPTYMVPQAICVLDQWPLNANGKIDRKALPCIAEKALTQQNEKPINAIELAIQKIWVELLGLTYEQIGRHDNFFELGGHSLLIMRMKVLIHRQFDIELSTKILFDEQSIEAIARHLKNTGTAALEISKVTGIGQRVPLSLAQQRLWLTDKIEGKSQHYNMFNAYEIFGGLQREILCESLNAILKQHNVLRSTFHVDEFGIPYQQVQDILEVPLAEFDLREENNEIKVRRVNAILSKHAQFKFDLSADCMLQACLICIEDEHYILAFSLHHIASDGWSVGILSDHLSANYNALLQGQGIEICHSQIQYADFAQWQRQEYSEDAVAKAMEFWQSYLRDAPVMHSLPLDRPRPPARAYLGAAFVEVLSLEDQESLRRLAREGNTTIFVVLHSLLALLMYRYSGQEDIVIGTAVNGRDMLCVHEMVGFFINTLPLRMRINPSKDFSSILADSKQTVMQALQYQHISFETIVEQLQIERTGAHHPVFQVLLTFDDYESLPLDLNGLTTSIKSIDKVPALYDLMLSAKETREGLTLSWLYDVGLFSHESIRQLTQHFLQLLKSAINTPYGTVSQMGLLTPTELNDLQAQWQSQMLAEKSSLCFQELFEQHVISQPDAIVVSDESQSLSYSQLNKKANQVAHRLRALGLKSDTLVGLCVNRNCDMLVGILGIVKAGGAYVPLDPTYPKQRLDTIIKDADLDLFVCASEFMEVLDIRDEQAICFSDPILKKQPHSNISVKDIGLNIDSRLYVIYTSGSTGLPKGVQICHKNVMTFIRWADQHYHPEELACVLASTTLNFDVSVFEIFVPLGLGYEIVIVKDALALLDKKLKPTIICAVPSAVEVLLDNSAIPDSTIAINIGGEKVAEAIVNRMLSSTKCKAVHHIYGPSEDTVYSTVEKVTQPLSGKLSLGPPVLDTRTYILSEHGQLVPKGVIGELYLGGGGVAKGYLNRPELTSEKFVLNPLSYAPDRRLYKTGDLVRRLHNGDLEYVGRTDNQIKIRGFRIELGEIEKQISSHPRVSQCVVIAQGEKKQGLLACVLSESAKSERHQIELVKEIKLILEQTLPRYMIPSDFVICQEFPRLPNGKRDMQKLLTIPPIELELWTSPDTEQEQKLLEIWLQLLNREKISTTANFFELGGNSLLATKLGAEINATWSIKISIKEVFENQTIQTLAAEIERLLELADALDKVSEEFDDEGEEWIV